MNIGVFGGSFNPVHNGHIKIAQEFIKAAKLDKLIVIPAGEPFYKFNTDMAPAKDRLNMCKIAFEGIADISDIEISQKGMSYTCDTLKAVKDMYPEGNIFMLCGSDVLNSINYWKNSEEIFNIAKICSFVRPGFDVNKATEEKIKDGIFDAVVFEADMPDISSTDVRERIKKGKYISSLVPPNIEKYIAENNIYKK